MASEKGIEEVVVEEPQEKGEKQEASTWKPSIPYEPIAPFLEVWKGGQKYDNDKEIYDVFRKCEVNMPLLDALKQIPRYAKFLKELCTTKKKQRLKGVQKVKVSKHVSAIFQQKLPPKCGYPGICLLFHVSLVILHFKKPC